MKEKAGFGRAIYYFQANGWLRNPYGYVRESLPANYFPRKSEHPIIILIFALQHEISHHIMSCYLKQSDIPGVIRQNNAIGKTNSKANWCAHQLKR